MMRSESIRYENFDRVRQLAGRSTERRTTHACQALVGSQIPGLTPLFAGYRFGSSVVEVRPPAPNRPLGAIGRFPLIDVPWRTTGRARTFADFFFAAVS